MTTDQFCRLCLEESVSNEDMIEIFDDEKTTIKISDVITQHFCWFEIHLDDKYSKKICIHCWSIVNEFHTLYIRVGTVHKKLNEKCWKESPTHDCTSGVDFELDVKCEEVSEDDNFADISHGSEPQESDVSNELLLKTPRLVGKKLNTKASKKCSEVISAPQKSKRMWKSKSERLDDERKISEFFNLKCDQCLVIFSSFFDLKTHQQSQHNVKHGFIYCCNKKFNRHAKLIEHMNWHLNPDSFRCKICQKVYSDNYGLRLHMAYHEPPETKNFECDICWKKFSRKTQLKHHLLVVHITKNKKDHKCNECGSAFGLNSILQSHIRGVHQNLYRHICDICAKEFKSKDQYQRHRLDHLKAAPKVVCICGARLKNASSLQAHIRRRHRESPRACPQCGKMSPNKDALRSHIQYVHTDSRQFRCTVCDKMFKKEVSLKEHMATHLGITLYTCSYCPKTFNSNANMHKHRKRMHLSEWQRDRARSS